jgi:hypothetical protein
MNDTFHIAPLDDRFHPLLPETAQFGQGWMGGSVAYIMSKPERTRPTRVLISSGVLSGVAIGHMAAVRHDQTGALLGRYTVVGVVEYDALGEVARVEGDVPDRKMAAAVFK